MSRNNKTWVIKLERNDIGKLLVEIETKRRELYDIYLFESHNKVKLVKLSEELDELINEYQQKAFNNLKSDSLFSDLV